MFGLRAGGSTASEKILHILPRSLSTTSSRIRFKGSSSRAPGNLLQVGPPILCGAVLHMVAEAVDQILRPHQSVARVWANMNPQLLATSSNFSQQGFALSPGDPDTPSRIALVDHDTSSLPCYHHGRFPILHFQHNLLPQVEGIQCDLAQSHPLDFFCLGRPRGLPPGRSAQCFQPRPT